jgi:hypothetical protein
MQAFPPSAEDQEYQRRFAPLGLLDAASPYPDCPRELAQALTAGAEAGKQKMEAALQRMQQPRRPAPTWSASPGQPAVGVFGSPSRATGGAR